MKALLHGGIEYRKDNTRNIFLLGGPATFPGILERLKKELTTIDEANTLLSRKLDFRLYSPPDPACAAWVAGAKCATVETPGINWVSRQEYHDEDPLIIERRFPHY